ncbi:MAG: hypothetical protein QOC81_2216 [Thermoanaerobaculia bacterium]|nr:hypothetical protein [Thermoanaerobaculia bacterium]
MKLPKHAAAAVLFAVLAILMTWPLLPNLGRAVAYPGDPYINTWVLDWDFHATFHQPGRLFQANIFYPAKYSLAFSENLYGIAVFLFPLRAVGVPPLAAYNVAMLLGYAMCGFFAYLLAKEVTGSTAGAIAAGIFYAFVPYRFTHLSHVQYVWAGTLPLLLFALNRYARVPDWRHAIGFGAAFLWNGLSNVHLFFFGSIAIVMTIAILRPPLRRIAITGAVAMLFLAPFLYPYYKASKLYGMERSWDESMDHSALPGDWLVDNFAHRFYPTHSDPKVDPERWLFPGALALCFALVAIACRQWKPLTLAWSWTFLGFIGSLGLRTPFYRFLFNYVPGFHAIRVPARWALITHVGLALLVAIAVTWIAKRAPWAGVIASLAFIAELHGPIRWYMAPMKVRPVDRWAASARPHAMAELPMSEQNDEYGVMLNATAHHRPIVNGVSGFAPPEYAKLVGLAQQWSDELVPELQRIGVTHVVVRADALDAGGRTWLGKMVDTGQLGFLRRFDDGVGGDWLFKVGVRSDNPDLRAMLGGHATYNEGTFGALLLPTGHENIKGRAIFSGVALSPFGIREVNLLFQNGTIRIPATLRADPGTSRWYRWYDATTKPAYIREFASRPKHIRPNTDVQVEIIDGRGDRTLLDDRWIDWY